jgi:hypothetical protein
MQAEHISLGLGELVALPCVNSLVGQCEACVVVRSMHDLRSAGLPYLGQNLALWEGKHLRTLP